MTTRTIGLIVNPGDGYRQVEITDEMTVQELVEMQTLQTYSITLDGNVVAHTDYPTRTLDGVQEVWAIGAVKGA